MITGAMSVATFLAKYWQQRPLLIKAAFPAFVDPLSPEELAGLACEAEVDARLVFTRKNTWELQGGPFKERDFTSLPAKNWTLLVQAVDQWLPGVRALLDSVPFIPNWRVDDVMISYATPNGGVGPHFDYYDVFLVQGQGSRIWKTGQHCGERDLLRTGSGLKLLKEFHTEQEWLLEPGDVLYVPPGVAHWGVSRDNSLCYSIGFRAPSLGEMLLGYAESLSDSVPADQRFTDPERKQPLRAGEIDQDSLRHARRMVTTALADEAAFNRWFGCQVTEPKNPDLVQAPRKTPDLQTGTVTLAINPASRISWQQHGKQLLVFADGACLESVATPQLLKLAQALATPGTLILSDPSHHNSAAGKLVDALLRQGTLVPAKRSPQPKKSR